MYFSSAYFSPRPKDRTLSLNIRCKFPYLAYNILLINSLYTFQADLFNSSNVGHIANRHGKKKIPMRKVRAREITRQCLGIPRI